MSTSGPRYHIPFPSNFLSLSPPVHKRTPSQPVAVTAPEPAPHNFLSNRPMARHSSISSVNSDDSITPPSPPRDTEDPRVMEGRVFSFLKVNSKFAPPPRPAAGLSGVGPQSSFLSNRH